MTDHKTIYTIGTSNRSFDAFVEVLHLYGVERAIDVRRFPTSRFTHFIKDNMSQELKQSGLSYVYYGDRLGGYRDGGYRNFMKTDIFQTALGDVERLGHHG